MNTAVMLRTTWCWSLLKSAYCPGRIPTIPTVGASSRRLKLGICSANCVQYVCCFLRKVAIRELCKVVFEEHTKNGFLCVNKPSNAFTFHFICVGGTPLIWRKQHNWLTRLGDLWERSNLIGVQARRCGSSKYTVLTYLAKNNNNEIYRQCPMKTNGKNANSVTLFSNAWRWNTIFQQEVSGDNKTQPLSLDAKVNIKWRYNFFEWAR
jgi:hypothetical protein